MKTLNIRNIKSVHLKQMHFRILKDILWITEQTSQQI
jgi:hypothetical protein